MLETAWAVVVLFLTVLTIIMLGYYAACVIWLVIDWILFLRGPRR